MKPNRRTLRYCPLLIASVMVWTAALHAQRLAKIEVKGLKRHSNEQVIAVGGLKIGQNLDKAAMDAAARRLRESGLFKWLTYSLNTVGARTTLTLNVEELSWEIPVIFDNFVWFQDAVLVHWVRQSVPTFDGSAPTSPGVLNRIQAALNGLLKERKIAGRVVYVRADSLEFRLTEQLRWPALSRWIERGSETEHVFRVEGASLPVCSIGFIGAEAFAEGKLRREMRHLLREPYSRKALLDGAREILLPKYQRRGYLQASLWVPRVVPKNRSGCNGVTASIQIQEGPRLIWSGARFPGARAFSGQDLEKRLKQRKGRFVNGVKLESGLESIVRAYGARGYIDLKLEAKPAVGEARDFTLEVSIEEGSKYRMGTFDLKGLSEKRTLSLEKKWRLSPGDPFDATYPRRFLVKHLNKELREALTSVSSELQVSLQPRSRGLTVDVAITLRNQ